MNLKSILAALLTSVSVTSFAAPTDVYTVVGTLEGSAVVGKEANFKIKYKWLTNQDRSAKIFYDVIGTDCKGEATIDKHSGLLPVSGVSEVKCTFPKSAVFRTTTSLKLYDGTIEKEVSDLKIGKISVTAQ